MVSPLVDGGALACDVRPVCFSRLMEIQRNQPILEMVLDPRRYWIDARSFLEHMDNGKNSACPIQGSGTLLLDLLTETRFSSFETVSAECVYFGVCGGCAFQKIDYASQLELKHRMVETALRDLIQAPIRPVIPSPKPYHYRHMVSMTVKRRHGTLRIGFMGSDRRTFVPVESCAIADEALNAYLPEALERLEALPEAKRFRTSQIVLRRGSSEEVVTSLREDRKKILNALVCEKQFSYAPSSFFQHNFSILNSFVEAVRTFLDPEGHGVLLDLYSGVGLFSIIFSDFYRRVSGFEEGYQAVERARENARTNGVSNVFFSEGKVEKLLPKLLEDFRKQDPSRPFDVITDPPRAGMKPEVIAELLKLPIRNLVYVSCELAALKRDLELLGKRFEGICVQPVDLFPQTRHIETIVLLRPRLV